MVQGTEKFAKEVHFPTKQSGPIPFCKRASKNGMGSRPTITTQKKQPLKAASLVHGRYYSAINCISISEILFLILPRMKPMNSSNTKRFDNAKISPLPYPPENFNL